MSGVELRELRMEPSAEHRRRIRTVWLAMCVAGFGSSVVVYGGFPRPVGWIPGIVPVLVIGLGIRLQLRRLYELARVTAEGDELQMHLPHATTVLGRRGRGRVVAVRVQWRYLVRTYRDDVRVFVDDRGCAHPYTPDASLWDLTVVDQMCDALEIPRFVDADLVTRRQLKRRYPVDTRLRSALRPRMSRWSIALVVVLNFLMLLLLFL